MSVFTWSRYDYLSDNEFMFIVIILIPNSDDNISVMAVFPMPDIPLKRHPFEFNFEFPWLEWIEVWLFQLESQFLSVYIFSALPMKSERDEGWYFWGQLSFSLFKFLGLFWMDKN